MVCMGAIDIEVKAYMSDKTRFADAFNFSIYNGDYVIQPDNLNSMDTTAITLPYGEKAKAAIQKYRDLLKLYAAMQDEQAIYLVLGLELQTHIHYAMPVRGMLYDALNYSQQVTEAAASYRKSNTSQSNEEFLSGFRKGDRLMPVITLTLCLSAEPWDAPTSIHEMLSVTDERLLKFVPDYKLNLLTPAQIAEEDFGKFRTGLGAVMQFAKHRNDQDVNWMAGNKRFEEMDRETADLIKTVTGADIRFDEKGEVVYMWAAWENGINQAKMDGRSEGRNEGREEATLCNIRNLMETSGWSARQTMDAMKIPANEQERYAKQI